LIVLAVPALVLRYEKRLLAKAELSHGGNQYANDVAAGRCRPNEIAVGAISSRVTPADSAA